MNIGATILARRRSLGLTRSELARRASISLATLQKIEAGTVNPRWRNVASIMENLGLQISFQEHPLDLDSLVEIGVPLSGKVNTEFLKNKDSHNREKSIQRIARVLQRTLTQKSKLELRVLEAISAYLFSIRTYYPSAYRSLLVLIPEAAHLITRPTGLHIAPGRLIKLSRMTKSLLSNIL